jgi:hypothetical protein
LTSRSRAEVPEFFALSIDDEPHRVFQRGNIYFMHS